MFRQFSLYTGPPDLVAWHAHCSANTTPRKVRNLPVNQRDGNNKSKSNQFLNHESHIVLVLMMTNLEPV